MHQLPDYNGHFVIGEQICDICEAGQRARCRARHRSVTRAEVAEVASRIGCRDLTIETDEQGGVITVGGLSDAERYYVRFSLGHAVLDARFPHVDGQYGRADRLRGYTSAPHSANNVP